MIKVLQQTCLPGELSEIPGATGSEFAGNVYQIEALDKLCQAKLVLETITNVSVQVAFCKPHFH